MKTLNPFKLIIILIWGLVCFACDDFTEIDLPQTQLTGNTIFQDELTATAALLDVYAQMRENGVISGNLNGLSMVMGLYTDDLMYYGDGLSPLDNFYNHTILSSNDAVLSLWSNSYSQIYAVNSLIEGLSNSSGISEEMSNSLRGEALFIRSLLHFYLINLYGEIPYITTTDYQVNSQVSRMPIEVVYDKITADLLEAKDLLPNDYPDLERTRVNKPVAQALLSRIYLYRGLWPQADLEASSIINNSALYNLESDLDKAFLKRNPSTIWQLHPGLSGANTLEGRFFIFTSGPPAIVSATNNLVDEFEVNDLRKQHWLKSVSDGTTTWYHPFKYKKNENTGTSEEYSIIFRLEEQYLIRAEARAQIMNLSGAQDDLNMTRNRAGLEDTPAANQLELLSAIMKERRLELFTEMGHRWFDLKRTGQAASILSPIKPGWHNRDLLLPLPESELILNNNLQPQNSGY